MFRYMFIMLWAVMVFSPLNAQAEEVVYDRILVKINSDIITQFDVDQEMKPILAKIGDRQLNASEQEQLKGLRTQVVDKMINDLLIEQEVQKYGIKVSEDRLDDEIRTIKEERGQSDEEFLSLIKQDGLTIDEFRSRLSEVIKKQELLGYMVHSKVVVTDSEIEEEYTSRHDDYVLEKLVSLSIIILPANISPQEVTKRIVDGELTFAEAAGKYTIGPAKDKGGSIGEVAWNDLADEWVESLAGVEEGGVGKPIEVQGKRALLSPVKIIENRLVPLEEVRDDIYKRLMKQKREEIFEEYFDKLKQSSVIVYMD